LYFKRFFNIFEKSSFSPCFFTQQKTLQIQAGQGVRGKPEGVYFCVNDRGLPQHNAEMRSISRDFSIFLKNRRFLLYNFIIIKYNTYTLYFSKVNFSLGDHYEKTLNTFDVGSFGCWFVLCAYRL
jgi:hypothetical protein